MHVLSPGNLAGILTKKDTTQSSPEQSVGLFYYYFFNGIRRVVYDCCSQLVAKSDSARIIKKGSPAWLIFAVKAVFS